MDLLSQTLELLENKSCAREYRERERRRDGGEKEWRKGGGKGEMGRRRETERKRQRVKERRDTIVFIRSMVHQYLGLRILVSRTLRK